MKSFITMCLLYITTFVIFVRTLLTTKFVRMLYVTLSVCTVFAMLGFSTTFFLIDVLRKFFFSLLKYGVGIVLTFIVAYTSAVFTMLGFCATFFIIDVLMKKRSLPKYGVGIMLVKCFSVELRWYLRCLGSARCSSSSTCS